jgi:RNA polymerase sigma factor (sigma-70 family)
VGWVVRRESSHGRNGKRMAQRSQERPQRPPEDDIGPTDRDLTLAFQRGEHGAFDAIYSRYVNLVNYLCSRALNKPSDVQDATQETFLRVYNSLPAFNGRYNLRGWIAAIAVNVCRDSLRASHRHSTRSAAVREVELQSIADDAPDPQAALLDEAKRQQVRSVVDSMSPHYRSALILRHVEEVSSGELARRLGISESQARALAHRARRAFKRSWYSRTVAGLLSLRTILRLRRPPAGERMASASSAAVEASPAFTSSSSATIACSSLGSQCGSVAVERIGAVVAAAVVGMGASTAAVGGAVEPRVVEAQEATVAADFHPQQALKASGPVPPPPQSLPTEVNPKLLAAADAVSEESESEESVLPEDTVSELPPEELPLPEEVPALEEPLSEETTPPQESPPPEEAVPPEQAPTSDEAPPSQEAPLPNESPEAEVPQAGEPPQVDAPELEPPQMDAPEEQALQEPEVGEQAPEEQAPDQITEEEAPDQVTEEQAPDQITEEEAPDQVPEEEAPDEVTEEQAPDQITEEEAPDQVPEEEAPDQITEEEAPDQVPEEEAPDQITEDEASDQVTAEAPSDQTETVPQTPYAPMQTPSP